jgi:DNA polymerase-3 subunit alpha
MNISDPTGQVAGMALFPEDFDATRRVLEAGPMVILALEARFNGGQFDPVARSASPMDTSGARGGMDLRVFIDRPDAAALVASLLDRIRTETAKAPPGKVTLCVSLDDPGEIDIPVGEFPVTPQVKGALRSLPGVMAVEEL